METRNKGIDYAKVDWLPKSYIELGTLSPSIYQIAASEAKMPFVMALEKAKSEADGTPTPYYGLTREEIHRKRWALRKEGKEVPARAIDLLLKAANLRAWGPGADTVEKFLQYSDTATLFAEVISDRVYASMVANSVAPNFLATTTTIVGNDYKKIMLDDVEGDRQLAEVGKGSELPVKMIRVGKHNVYLKKFGMNVRIAYEDIKWASVNILGVVLDRVGLQAAVDSCDDMFTVAINGDGNSNTPGTTVTPATANTIEMADCIEWWSGMPTPYKMNRHVSRKAIRIKYATALADLKITLGTFEQNIGINVPAYDEWDRSAVTTGYFIGFDTRFALEKVTNGDAMTETGNIIQRQLKDTTFSLWEGYSVIDPNAIALWNTTSGG